MDLDNKAHNECWSCVHREEIPGDAHIRCSNPGSRVDGNDYGKKRGWFNYPLNFDPTWKTTLCANFETDK